MNLLEDFLIREIILTHNPVDYHRLDSETLLDLVESILSRCQAFDPQLKATCTDSMDLSESCEEPVSRIIYMISSEIHSQSDEHQNLHKKTLSLLQILGRYRWDAKIAIAVASFAHIFALFSLVMQLQPESSLAVSLAIVRQHSKSSRMTKAELSAMNFLVKTMLKVARIIIGFEEVSPRHELVENRAMDTAKSTVYVAAYWVIRSVLVCSSQIADLRRLRIEQVYSDRSVVAAWGLHSLGHKLNLLCQNLEQCTEYCQEQIETRLSEKLVHLFKEKQSDNQKALHTLFASQTEFPFKKPYSRDKIGILDLKNKIILLLITPPDLLPLNQAHFLIRQTESGEDSAVIWLPIPPSDEWSVSDKAAFEFFSNRLPWLSVRKPWLLNSSVVSYIRLTWGFGRDPLMVVLEEHGLVANPNAMDMVWVWGPKAYPFSSSRAEELWEEEGGWSIDLLVDGISPLLSEWVKEGKNICIYGSDNLDWIKEFTEAINKLKTISGAELEILYVGCKNPNENIKNIINIIDQENLSASLTFSNVHLFWFRLEAVERSAQDRAIAARLAEISGGWAVIGRGSSPEDIAITLDLERIRECVALGREVVEEIGLVAAIGISGGGGGCRHDEVVEYEEGLEERMLVCGSCRRPVEKFVLYKCDQ